LANKYPVAGIDSESRFGWNQNMRLITLAGAVAVLAGCHPHVRRDMTHQVAPIVDVAVAPRSIPRETAAIAREPQPEVSPPELNPAAGVQRLDPARVIAETNGRLRDVYFDYDRSELRGEALSAVQEDAKLLAPILNEFHRVTVWIEGHCDERGSAEYNLALGDSRASRVTGMLRNFGLAAARLHTISYGRENPQCTESAESCWQRNRRAHLVVRDDNAPGN
jgi:outer membrane protein OmpA-like peptidoglycan-associated protein